MNQEDLQFSPQRRESAMIGDFKRLKDMQPADMKSHPLAKSQKQNRPDDRAHNLPRFARN